MVRNLIFGGKTSDLGLLVPDYSFLVLDVVGKFLNETCISI
jgi:hypothetical protein